MKTARLIIAESEHDANLLYATGFFAPDPFIYFETGGRKFMVMSDLEIDRARKQAQADRVLSYNHYVKRLKRAGLPAPRLADVALAVLREQKIGAVEVPASFPLGLAKKLRGLAVRVTEEPFYPERLRKTAAEVRKICAALELAEAGMDAAFKALRASRIKSDGYLYWRREKLTSEHIQGVINATIASLGGVAMRTIAACGNQGCDPHEPGHGPLRAHQTIILDIFPRDSRTGYWGDITRTVVRGRASDKVKELYALVSQAQEIAFAKLRAGIDGQSIHVAIQHLFEHNGWKTRRAGGLMQGFFHGTGHGVGLEIHEAPRLSHIPCLLEAGQVVTVEPGLYYPGIGGVRLEDVVLIQPRGVRTLTTFPKFLEI